LSQSSSTEKGKKGNKKEPIVAKKLGEGKKGRRVSFSLTYPDKLSFEMQRKEKKERPH